MSTYAWILLTSLILPFALSFHPRIRFDRHWKSFGLSCLVISSMFILWDAQFTNAQVWGFNPLHHSRWLILGMPIEEVLFFLVIPYCCTFTYEVLQVVGIHFQKPMKTVHLSLGVLAAILSAVFIGSVYTSTVCLVVAVTCMATWQAQGWLSRAYLSFAVLLIPFIVVNGVLTGAFITEEVVWYSDQAITGWRIGTIPIEDVLYFFAMFFAQIALYERIKSASKEKLWKEVYFQLSK